MKKEKVAVFVDVQNVYYTVKQQYAKHFNYKYFWQKATANCEVINAYAYAIDRNDTQQRNFQNILRTIGFEVKLKPFIQRSDGSAKGDWDVGITLDLIELAPTVDRIVLVSGDGDFDMLVNKARQQYNTLVEVYGVSALTADSLVQAASRFIPIESDFLL